MIYMRKSRYGMVGVTIGEDRAVITSHDLPGSEILGKFDTPEQVIAVYHAQIDEIDANIAAMKQKAEIGAPLDWEPPQTH